MDDPRVPHRTAALAAFLARTAARGQVRWNQTTATYIPVDRTTDSVDAQADAATVALLLTALWRRRGHAAFRETSESATAAATPYTDGGAESCGCR